MSNLKAEFEIKPSAEYKAMTREVGKIVYKGDKHTYMRLYGVGSWYVFYHAFVRQILLQGA